MQPIRRVEEAAVRRDHHLGREVCSGEALRQSRKRLLGRECSLAGIIVEYRQCRGLLLQAIQPTAALMECEMTWPVAGWQSYRRRFVWQKFAIFDIELPGEDLIQPQVRRQHKAPGCVSLDHVRMRPFMAADRETSRRRAGRVSPPYWSSIAFHVSRGTQFSFRPDRKHCHSRWLFHWLHTGACGRGRRPDRTDWQGFETLRAVRAGQ